MVTVMIFVVEMIVMAVGSDHGSSENDFVGKEGVVLVFQARWSGSGVFGSGDASFDLRSGNSGLMIVFLTVIALLQYSLTRCF